ncbi:MAG: trigger factor [Gemmatimonadetes bacterium]|nr:trigger factor [Gemmatimonadota bacterium]
MPDILITKTGEEPGAKNLRVEVPVEHVKAAEDKATAFYSRRARLPGFRKGKAPKEIVRRRFHDAIREDVIRDLVGQSWKAAVEQERLKPIADPRIRDLKFESDAPVSFELIVEVKPDIVLTRLGGFTLQRKVAAVTDEIVRSQVEQLRRTKAPWVPLTGTPAPGDLVQITLATLEDGQPTKDKRYDLVLGEGQAIPDVESRILALEVGRTVDADVRLPDDFPDAAKRGQQRAVRMTLHEAKRQALPDIDDAFAREMGDFESVADLERAVRQDLEAEAAREADADVRHQLLEQLVAANNVQAPRPLVERVLATFAQTYQVPDDQLERFAAEFGPISEAQVKRDLALDFVVESQSLKATEEDVDARITELARRRKAEPGQLYASLQKAGRLRDVERSITEEKAIAYLLRQSTVTEV